MICTRLSALSIPAHSDITPEDGQDEPSKVLLSLHIQNISKLTTLYIIMILMVEHSPQPERSSRHNVHKEDGCKSGIIEETGNC